MKKKYCKPKTEAIAMETNLFVMQSNKTTLKSGDNVILNSNTQEYSEDIETGGDEQHDGNDDLGAAKRWSWYTGPFE